MCKCNPILSRTSREMGFFFGRMAVWGRQPISVCTRSVLQRVLRCSIISLAITFIDIFSN